VFAWPNIRHRNTLQNFEKQKKLGTEDKHRHFKREILLLLISPRSCLQSITVTANTAPSCLAHWQRSSDNQLMFHVSCPSARPYRTIQVPLVIFSWKFILTLFSKICLHVTIFVTIGQKSGTFFSHRTFSNVHLYLLCFLALRLFFWFPWCIRLPMLPLFPWLVWLPRLPSWSKILCLNKTALRRHFWVAQIHTKFLSTV
jgi:hypothetical protein